MSEEIVEIFYENISVKVDFLKGTEEWREEDKILFRGQFKTDKFGQILSGTWIYKNSKAVPEDIIISGTYCKGELVLIEGDDDTDIRKDGFTYRKYKKNPLQGNYRFVSDGSYFIFSCNKGEYQGAFIDLYGELRTGYYSKNYFEGTHNYYENWESITPFFLTGRENYKKGKLSGLKEDFYDTRDPDGALIPYERVNFYLENGGPPIWHSCNYKRGLKHGKEIFYHDWFYMFTNYSEHILRWVCHYKDDLRHGRWEFYDKKGNLESIERYEDGNQIYY